MQWGGRGNRGAPRGPRRWVRVYRLLPVQTAAAAAQGRRGGGGRGKGGHLHNGIRYLDPELSPSAAFGTVWLGLGRGRGKKPNFLLASAWYLVREPLLGSCIGEEKDFVVVGRGLVPRVVRTNFRLEPLVSPLRRAKAKLAEKRKEGRKEKGGKIQKPTRSRKQVGSTDQPAAAEPSILWEKLHMATRKRNRI